MTITSQLPDLFPDDGPELPVSLAAQALSPDATITAQADLAVPLGVPGFGGQGWSTHETMLTVKWLLSDPAAWDRAMSVARQYPGNPHAVADTLHERIVPRTVLEAIAVQGLDPARVNWLEVAHELIERRDDPRPDPDGAVTMAGDAAAEDGADPVPAAVGSPVPDDPVAVSMYTAHRIDDTFSHLSHASERLQAARDASGDLRTYHSGHVAYHLDQALATGQKLADHLRRHYPAEGEELDKTAETIGLAEAVSEDAKTATTAHLLQTILYDEGHASRHADAMLNPASDEEWSFNHDHAAKHVGGAAEHAAKLAEHLQSNYPREGKWLDGLHGAEGEKAGTETISGQAARHEAVS